MFSRNTSKPHYGVSMAFGKKSKPPRKPPRPMLSIMTVLVAALIVYVLLPEPKTRKRRAPLTADALKSLVATMTTTERPTITEQQKTMAALGRKLFNDVHLSTNNAVACSTCHNPALSFTDGRAVGMGLHAGVKNAPTTINHFLNAWFMWDGRADSLAAQALKPIEDPNEHGFSRLGVAQLLLANYDQDYQKVFGSFPRPFLAWSAANALKPGSKDTNPAQGLPAASGITTELEKALNIDLAAYSLATLGRFSILNDILGTAQRGGHAPAVELTRRAFAAAPGLKVDPTWEATFDHLTAEEQQAINQVFANFGQALAAYERGLVALDSPFDRFAARLATAADPQQALDESFDAQALAGLLTFTSDGQCNLCHAGPNFTDQQFHNIGLAQTDDGGDRVDLGRATGMIRVQADPFNCEGEFLKVTDPEQTLESCRELPFLSISNLEMVGAFKTPSLRNVAATGPYMHDGRFTTLTDVLKHYNDLEDKPAVGHREELLKPLDLTSEELKELEAFLRTLSSPIEDLTADTADKVVWKP